MAEREVIQLEEPLKEYLLDELTRNPAERDHINAQRYINLRIAIDTTGNFKEPNFKVQIGILEAIFTIEEGIKLSGALGAVDEVLVAKWLEFGSNRAILRTFWLGESIDKKKGRIVPFDLD